MERSSSRHELNEDDDRKSRFQNTTGNENGSSSLRDRASSQPPGPSDNTSLVSSSPSQHYFPSNVGGPWTNSRMLTSGRVQPVPIRSPSISTNPQGQFSSAMRERVFPSTFEDDETEALSDTYDDSYVPQSLSRGRTYGQDPSRSRSQSLATSRPGLASPYTGSSAMSGWNGSFLNNTNIPTGQQRYGEIRPPGSSRYGSLGTLARSPSNIHSSSPSGASFVANGFSNRNQQPDITNMSPFVRDVGQILIDDGAAFRELWAGMHPPRDENGGGGSGTTSRRHSVSVVQPRRGNVVGFHAPGNDVAEEPSRSSFQPTYARSGLLLSDDDLASDLGLLNINPNESTSSSSSQHPPSQPSSLPIYAPLSRSPPSRDLVSAYQSINLNIPGGTTYSRQAIGSPSEDFPAGSNSPGLYDQHLTESHFNPGRGSQLQHQQQQSELTARYIPGKGIQYMPPQQQGMHHPPSPQYGRTRAPSYSSTSNLATPMSPSTGRAINPQQPPYYPQTQRRLSDAQHHLPSPSQPHHQQNLSDLGKGVPLHAVPSSWPLFIVEFKAGRTDLFYLTDLLQNIRTGDLVMVEADRGKDLGTVVNDSITLGEVEAFQRQQMERGFGGGGSGSGGEPTSPGGMTSPGGSGNGKKEINPKMIYGKATTQEMQLLAAKNQDEQKALQLCQSKVRAKKLPMEVIDAEYQWDRRKLTFYFVAEKRIDFRELVRELFRLYKTRIWMASLQGGGEYEQ